MALSMNRDNSSVPIVAETDVATRFGIDTRDEINLNIDESSPTTFIPQSDTGVKDIAVSFDTKEIDVSFEESSEIIMVPEGGGGSSGGNLPLGGKKGQYLAKRSNADYDAYWASFVHYVHEQVVSSSIWTITHNLKYYPSVTVVDTANSVVHGDVHYIDENTLTISFNGAFSGKAYLN